MKSLWFLYICLALSAVQGQMISDLLQLVILDVSNEIKALRGEIKEYAKKADIIDILNKSLTESQETMKDMLEVYATKENIKEALNISLAEYATKDDIEGALNTSLAELGTDDGKAKLNIERICEASKVSYIEDLGYVSLVKEGKSWQDARDFCLSSGGRLLEGLQRKHYQPLLEILGGLDYSGIAYVGIYNETWLSSGVKVNLDLYHNNDPSRGKEVCGHFHFKKDCHGLGDYDCVKEKPFLCQYYADH
ncbi:uncharacterized protein [Palaemon carinicauda]|uniref:uncharacterized protein n=1 Tax=Palaemon carinicauda TaxID=392227 RepID=UPI0035B6714E